jgi:hypothetical protein
LHSLGKKQTCFQITVIYIAQLIMSTPTIVERSLTLIPPRGSINDDRSDYSGSFLNEDCEALLSNLNIDTEDDVSDHTVRARKSLKVGVRMTQ